MSSPIETLSTALCPWLEPARARLEAALESGRFGHAWLIGGPPGVGKINLALVIANRLLNPAAPRTTRTLGPAEAAAAARDRHAPTDHHPDLHWLFPEEDKHAIAVEQIRDAAATLTLKAYRGGAKVIVIEPADGMTTAAANALLKTLEEPTTDTYLLLVSHQPYALPATIRSRCQRLEIARPPLAEVARWLGADPAALRDVWAFTGRAPLEVAGLAGADVLSTISKLRSEVEAVSSDRAAVQSVASVWSKDDPGIALTWLRSALHAEIRARLAPASKSVTDPDRGTLHNPWAELTLRRLFEQYEKADRLLSQLGSGINVDLALQAMLLGFQDADRGPQ